MLREVKPGEDFGEWLLEELSLAYLEARKGKRSTNDEQFFEMHSMENLINLRDSILNRTYKPSRGIAFVTRKPVIREIFAAPFRDRVVHHFLYNGVADWWDRRFIYDSYSCRLQKGTWFGIYRCAKQMQAASDNFTKKTMVIKLDIQGYFMSLPRKKLFERIMWGLDQQFPEKGKVYQTLKYLWHEVIFDDPTVDVRRRGPRRDWEDLPRNKSLFCQPPGKGIVIGNLSSQLLSNIYLDQLDRFIKFDLKYKYYGRYVDDFFFYVQEKDFERAKDDIRRIEIYLRDELGLTLHPKKRYVQDINRGVAFLGAVVFPHRIVTGKRIARNFRKAVREFSAGKKEVATVVSYMGLLKNLKGKKLTKEIFEEVGWDFRD
ncbi:RNA-directed DNA polymerase [Candidatus Saccharibacteria bacterium]|nr:RNA-directed DNA polymerase [Candidatus Saccharibacteria bacterium]